MDDPSHRPPMRQNAHMGVNKMGKNIKKSPLHQPNFASATRDQPPPQVYNINKNDFRDIVQQLTGSPLRDPPLRPTQNPPKAPNDRLQRIRPPPLAQTTRSQVPIQHRLPVPAPAHPLVSIPRANNLARPHPPSYYGQPAPNTMLPPTPTDVWTNTAESPITAYARYLQNSIIDPGPRQPQAQAMPQPDMKPQFEGQNMPQHHLLHNSMIPPFPPPRANGLHSNLPSPRLNVASDVFSSPHINPPMPAVPSPWMSGHPPPLLSPTSQFLLPSPTGFLTLLSPRSPYPLLSPGYQHPHPISPNFSFSSVPQPGILGPGPPLPPSPGYGFPLSPGFFPASSPRWKDQ